MTNIINFSELIGVQPTVHRYEIADRVILYTSPTLAAQAAQNRVNEIGADNLTLATVYAFYTDLLRGQRYEDGKETTDDWLDTVTMGDAVHFRMFMDHPAGALDRLDAAQPLTLRSFRGYDVVLPPVTLGDYRMFVAYLAGGERTQAEFWLEQIGAAFDNATLTDGSPLPETLLHGLTEEEASALVNFWMNCQKADAGNAEGTPPTGETSKKDTRQKSRPSSSKRSASRRSRR